MSAGAPKKDKIPKESTRWLLSDPVVRALFARPWKREGSSQEEALKPWIRRCDDETVRHPPADLDLTPYEDEHDRKILRELGVKN